MKTINKINRKPENTVLNQIFKLLFLSVLVLVVSCSDDEKCAYEDNCEETCNLFEDFEKSEVGSPGNWLGLALNDLDIISRGGSNVLYADDGSGASWAYNTRDFPENLLEAGCALLYQVEYFAGDNNSVTTDNSLVLFDGSSPATSTNLASFVLNPASLIVSGSAPVTIEVPLELATGSTLPSNAFGSWVINGVSNTTPPTAADVLAFNTLIQNISGVAFFIDEGANPVEEWWFDNFCFKQCCP